MTVNCVLLAEVTVPVAPPLKETVLLPAVLEKPKPWMVRLVALAARLAVLDVTTGITLATCTVELLKPLTLTEAVRLPTTRPLRLVTVNCVLLAEVTVPVAPPLKETVLLPAVLEKPKPWMVRLVAFAARLIVLEVTVGATEPLTWMSCSITPVLVFMMLLLMPPALAAALIRTSMVVLASVPPAVGVSVSVLVQVVPSVDSSTPAGAVTITSAARPGPPLMV